ncbi:hypothetical protein CCACVL1_30266 [Corchorus capsularis]|uniref:Myb-like domain-containing protein n=1 Tax=Corchorus capsularis TaxID=210143 RepID=A0A1R3FY61_COCAP|nr:hypothetical protein CCACVL1_30266 [Corchorus capsularis]
MIEKKAKKQKRGSISEEDVSIILQRYTATTILALLNEISQNADVELNWNALVNKTSTGISNAREYQMLWRHLAYRDELVEKFEDGAEPLDDDSDLEYELEPFPFSSEATAEAAACVKVLIASGFPSDSSLQNSSTVEAPLTINIPNGQSFRASSDNSHPSSSMRGMNITVPVSVQRQIVPAVTSAEPSLEGNGPGSANLPPRRKRKPWSKAEDMELFAAVQKYGVGNWAAMLRGGDFKGERTTSQLSQRWAIIKKRFNLNLEATSAASQLSEAQLATRSALFIALDMQNLTAGCTNNPGLKTAPSNSALPTTSGEALGLAQSQQGHVASVQAQTQPQQGPSTSVSAKNQPQKGPNTALPSQNQPQQGPTTSVSAKNQPQKGPNTALPSQNQPQQGPIASDLPQNQPQKGPITALPAQTHPQKGPITALPAQTQPQKGTITALPAQTQPQKVATTALPGQSQPQQGPSTSVLTNNQPQKGPSTALPSQNLSWQGSVASVQVPNQSQQGPVTTKTSPQASLAGPWKCRAMKKPAAKPFSFIDATAVAAGARIADPRRAASFLKAAQSKHAIHIMTSGASSVKPLMPSGTSEVHSNVQCVSADLTAEPVSSPVATSSTLHPGSVRSAIQRAEDTPSPSSSLNVSIQQSNAVTSSPTVEGLVNEEPEAAGEDKGSVSDSLPRETIPENRACVPQNDTGEAVDKNEPAVSNQESDSKNHEGEIRVSVSDSLHKELVQENGACMPRNEPGEGVKEHKPPTSNEECESKDLEAVAECPNEKPLVEGNQVDVAVNLGEQSQK